MPRGDIGGRLRGRESGFPRSFRRLPVHRFGGGSVVPVLIPLPLPTIDPIAGGKHRSDLGGIVCGHQARLLFSGFDGLARVIRASISPVTVW